MEIDTELVQLMTEKFNLSLIAFGNVIPNSSVPYYGSAGSAIPHRPPMTAFGRVH